jgi:methyltransferase (TIGR00027 family)
MVGGKVSRTARWVAAERAVLTDMGVLADPFAQEMLTPSMSAGLWFVNHLPYRVRASSVTLAGLAARVLWFDAQVSNAIDAGIEQIALIGAGYDSRAIRFRGEAVQYFELDHEATQSDKMLRAPASAAIYVDADLAAANVATKLLEHGLDESRPTMFVVEGVTMYLDEEVVGRQLGELKACSARGSRLAIDFYPRRQAGTATNRRQARLQRLTRMGSGEGFRMLLDRSEAVALVTASGWDVNEATGMRATALALVSRESGLRLDAVSDHKTLLTATSGS